MDILYVNGLGYESFDNDITLKYSLRSLEKYGKNVGQVYVVGYCPDWLSDEVIKIERNEQMFPNFSHEWQKAANIGDNIYYAIDQSGIGNEFIVSMDDHFYIAEADFDNYPYHAKLMNGSEIIPDYKSSTPRYTKYISGVKEFLTEHGLSAINFTLHRNMHLSRESLEGVRELFTQSINEERAAELFVLANNWKYTQEPFDFTAVEDAKIKGMSEIDKIDPSFTDCFALNNVFFYSKMKERMAMMYPDRSKYEKEIEENEEDNIE